jgi:hypothetical protein
MAHNDRYRRKIFREWLDDEKCCYCGEPMRVAITLNNLKNLLEHLQKLDPEILQQRVALTKLPQKGIGKLPEDMATIEHLRSRLHPKRQEIPENGEKRIAVACRKCNNEQGSIEQAEVPLEELRRRACEGLVKKREKRKNKNERDN